MSIEKSFSIIIQLYGIGQFYYWSKPICLGKHMTSSNSLTKCITNTSLLTRIQPSYDRNVTDIKKNNWRCQRVIINLKSKDGHNCQKKGEKIDNYMVDKTLLVEQYRSRPLTFSVCCRLCRGTTSSTDLHPFLKRSL
jgi:hypothetical protein